MSGVKLAIASEDLAAMGVDYSLGTKVVTNKRWIDPQPNRVVRSWRKAGSGSWAMRWPLSWQRRRRRQRMPPKASLPTWRNLEPSWIWLLAATRFMTRSRTMSPFDWRAGDVAAVEGAMAGAAHVVTTRVADNRVICNSMEPRGCFAEWDGERLHFSYSGQGVWGMKEDLIACFGLGKDQVRVTTPDVGGGFGMKAFGYPEYFAVAACAWMLGRPVALDVRAHRGDAGRQFRPGPGLRHCARLRFRIQDPGLQGQHVLQPWGLPFGRGAADSVRIVRQGCHGSLRRPDGGPDLQGVLHQYRSGRRIPRRRTAGGNARARAIDRQCRPRARR